MIAQDDVLELVHARVGKHQRRVVLNHHGSGRDDVVSLAFEETLERVSDFVCSQHILSNFLSFRILRFFKLADGLPLILLQGGNILLVGKRNVQKLNNLKTQKNCAKIACFYYFCRIDH